MSGHLSSARWCHRAIPRHRSRALPHGSKSLTHGCVDVIGEVAGAGRLRKVESATTNRRRSVAGEPPAAAIRLAQVRIRRVAGLCLCEWVHGARELGRQHRRVGLNGQPLEVVLAPDGLRIRLAGPSGSPILAFPASSATVRLSRPTTQLLSRAPISGRRRSDHSRGGHERCPSWSRLRDARACRHGVNHVHEPPARLRVRLAAVERVLIGGAGQAPMVAAD